MTYDPDTDPRYIIDLRQPGWAAQLVKMRGMERLLFEMIALVEYTHPQATYLTTLQANLQYALDIYASRHIMEDEIMGMVQTCFKELCRKENEEKNRWLGNTDTLESD